MEADRPLSGSRRRFLGAAALLGLTRKAEKPIRGSFVNDDHLFGHELRHHGQCLKRPQAERRVAAVIVGGGIAGLSAAWRFDKRGFRDFVVLEAAASAGGNSRWGENSVSAYPWAAHYVPVPARHSAPLVRELMEELGVLRDGVWAEEHLCHSPQERLFLHGRWQEHIEPEIAVSSKDREQYQRFAERMEQFRRTGEFTIPMEAGARPSPLDRISMRRWLLDNGFDSPSLHWLVDYSCRDDYGALSSATSAWAGIHYFAAREPEDRGPLVWPEGNGWIVRRLLGKLGRYVRTNALVYSIRPEGLRYRVRTEEFDYLADAVIFAAPVFLAPYIVEPAPPVKGFEYSPWITANLTLERWPKSNGAEPAWDNVIYDSPSLGYVVATHQSLRTRQEKTVWTWYHALAYAPPAESRRLLLETDWHYWKEFILDDLARAHPDIRQCVSRIDMMRMGHAMVRPSVGFVFSGARRALARLTGRFVYAHADVSGFSIFEEAQYRGVRAAEHILRALGA